MENDILAIKTKWMRNIISKVLSNEIKKKTGIDVVVNINELAVLSHDETANLNANLAITLSIPKKGLGDLIEKMV
ncbi:hypothetical protein [Lachnoclostridium sp. Marseille-P6806]|uniref:hypothetical protein n=1 Tax=Lachnoclostridium sp. Marseille-P6806 TaxID=2364793 RepID=UPI001030B61C|nr:hypothetical protein [Lachnoclostridium sp. Marseille-P6806]